MNAIELILRVANFAAQRHRDQRRKGSDAQPYINHLLDVANMLCEIGGIDDPEVLAAAILHDTIEDTETTKEELLQRFGKPITSLVLEVTDDMSLPRAQRKQAQIEHAPHLSPGAKVIKLADKISNIRDLTDHSPVDWSRDRHLEYLDWAESVVAGLRGVNPSLEKYFEESVARARKKLA
ncbi:HD domain-containing protein [Leptolyngbya sp. 7M]|uniref:HD domain-containing protein n=1 Tax=Leptolyngbya sp. 7M TaxID=2812896 RepID=UPI001B8D2D7B|nr:HD domain-containing protein [Leptolyngbya sp. 7M]QYO66454.1 HD domain-containing protein [Leptolyngbya sp. 7M]